MRTGLESAVPTRARFANTSRFGEVDAGTVFVLVFKRLIE
jgi:hypothetical protein